MICFNCGLKLNIGDEKECPLCGAKFTIKCPSCKFPNPAAGKYCFNCGLKITKSDIQSSVHNFDKLTESRKNVAVIFADVSGFTAFSEKMDPEEVRELINDCFSYITRPVYELEGTIDKYIGDCIMILFGAKYSHGDDAKRAVMCAMEMINLVRDFSDERLSSKGFSLNLSIGINYGLVVTGSIGNYFDKDYTVMGDIVNTAQRLQSNAGEGTILVSESIYMETRDMIDYSDVREVAVKNKENPVRCYLPLRLNNDYFYERELFVERENEINQLNSIFNNILNTSTQCITVVGEAGAGKTRLIKEFTSKLGSGIKKIWVDCSSVFQNRAYFVISSILINIMNINPEDSTSIKQHRLMSFLDYILSDFSNDEKKKNFNFISFVLGLDRDNEFQNIFDSMSFESIKREISKQLSIFFINLCKKYRVMVIIDDIHWADTGSLNILTELIAQLSVTNSMFIFSSRNEMAELRASGDWRYHILKLEMLGASATRTLACKLLDCNDIDNVLFDSIVKFTVGNPLYIREFISNIKRTSKYYIKDGIACAQVEETTLLPTNIQNLILSKLSELDDITKNILQAASVIGKDFNLSLINYLLDCTINETNDLRLPVQLNIITLKSVHTASGIVEKVFTFNHDVEREVIYDSILNRKKKELHKKIGDYMESRYLKEIENYYEILCTHFYKAGIIKKARDYYYKTAVKHKNDFNFINALEYFNKFLELSGTEHMPESDARIVYAYRDMGYMNFVTADYDLALEYLNKALNIAYLSDDIYSIKIMIAEIYKDKDMFDYALATLDEIEPRMKQDNSIYGRLLQMKCDILRTTGNPAALGLAKKSERILLKVKDYQNLSETMKQAGIIYFTKGEIDNALFFMNKSYKYAEKANNLEIMAKVSGDMGIIYHSTGMVSKAQESFIKSLDISKKISYLRGYVAACINLGILYMDKGIFNKAEALLKESLDISREILSRLYECISLTNLGDIMYERGLNDRALDYYNKSLEIAKTINLPVEEGVNYIGLVKVYIKLDLYEKVSEILEAAYKLFNDANEVMYLSDYYIYKGLYELQNNNADEALKYCEKAISSSAECRNDRKMLKALRLKGNILLYMNDFLNAVKLFDKAVILAEQVESDYEVAKSYYGRFKASILSGSSEEAEMSLAKAKESISKIDQCRWTQIIEEQMLKTV